MGTNSGNSKLATDRGRDRGRDEGTDGGTNGGMDDRMEKLDVEKSTSSK